MVFVHVYANNEEACAENEIISGNNGVKRKSINDIQIIIS